jgi:hypothetical protein
MNAGQSLDERGIERRAGGSGGVSGDDVYDAILVPTAHRA